MKYMSEKIIIMTSGVVHLNKISNKNWYKSLNSLNKVFIFDSSTIFEVDRTKDVFLLKKTILIIKYTKKNI